MIDVLYFIQNYDSITDKDEIEKVKSYCEHVLNNKPLWKEMKIRKAFLKGHYKDCEKCLEIIRGKDVLGN